MGAMGDSVMIEFRNLSKHDGGQAAVADLKRSVDEGEFFVLVGGLGSGKSTTLRMINALTEPSEGNAHFRGKRIKDDPIRPLHHRIGYALPQITRFAHHDGGTKHRPDAGYSGLGQMARWPAAQAQAARSCGR